MNNVLLEDAIQLLTKQMIKDNFQNRRVKEEKYIISKQDLYKFSIKLVRLLKEIEGVR